MTLSPRTKRQRVADSLGDNDDVRCASLKPLLSPAILMEEIPLSEKGLSLVAEGRRKVAACVDGTDDRLLVIVGPCSIHDVKAAREYAEKLRVLSDELSSELVIVMRVYFEKPRTTVGWKGLINDPDLNDTFNINKGLRMARELLRDIVEIGLPTSWELLDTISPQFLADLISWGAIGARTTESQIHRELASGISAPVGFKNGTDGSVQIAVDAIRSASNPHTFLGVTKQGLAAIVRTTGNTSCHVILRGSNKGPNYEEEYVKEAVEKLNKAKCNPRIMIDCSHGNSRKDHKNQPIVCGDIAKQVSSGNANICGVMIESNLVAGRQDLISGQADKLEYGKSITDACIDFNTTEQCLRELAQAVQARRKK